MPPSLTQLRHFSLNSKNIRIMDFLVINELHAGEELSLLYNICIIW